MDLFYVLLILLVATRAFGEVAERLAQPALVGELTAGVALGAVVASFPGIFPTLSGLGDNEVFVTITDLGMFFLMLFAGLEMQPRKMFERSASSLGVAFGGMVVPLALGVGLGWAFLPDSPLRTAQCLFLGTALAITASPGVPCGSASRMAPNTSIKCRVSSSPKLCRWMADGGTAWLICTFTVPAFTV